MYIYTRKLFEVTLTNVSKNSRKVPLLSSNLRNGFWVSTKGRGGERKVIKGEEGIVRPRNG